MAKARVVKFCTQVDYIISYLKDDKPPLKGAWLGSRDPFFNFTPIISLYVVKIGTLNFNC